MNAKAQKAKAQKFPDYDESKPHEWPDVDESDLRGEVRALVATHGRVATERRYYDDRAILRVRSVKLTPDGEPAAVRCWQRHGDYDCWAPREWVTFPDDAEPLEDAHGAVEEARCWLHELALALCGCPAMAEALRPSPWGAVTGEPESANPFVRSPDAARMVLPVVWRTSCPACRANTREADEEPGLVCPECGHARVCWRCGIDREPRVEWAPRTNQDTSGPGIPGAGAGDPASVRAPDVVQPAVTVAAGPYMRAEGPLEAPSPPSVSEAPPLAPPRTVCRECLGSGRDRHGIIARDCADCGGRGYERVADDGRTHFVGDDCSPPHAPLVQPTPAVVALVAQVAGNVEARGAPAAKQRRNHRWDREAGRCTRCGVAIGKRDGVACTDESRRSHA